MYLAVFGPLSLGLGAVIRRTAGTIAILVAVLVFLPASTGALPAAWRNDVSLYLPSAAGQVIIGFTPPGHLPAPWTGFAMFCGYTAAVLIAAAITLSRRDA